MNLSESNTLNFLLRWLLGGGRFPSDAARDAAGVLAARSYHTLKAGLTPDEVTAQWPGDLPGEVERMRAGIGELVAEWEGALKRDAIAGSEWGECLRSNLPRLRALLPTPQDAAPGS
ncbi:hypothetical protein GCM10022221_67180 [Actinocorallia aurea]